MASLDDLVMVVAGRMERVDAVVKIPAHGAYLLFEAKCYRVTDELIRIDLEKKND